MNKNIIFSSLIENLLVREYKISNKFWKIWKAKYIPPPSPLQIGQLVDAQQYWPLSSDVGHSRTEIGLYIFRGIGLYICDQIKSKIGFVRK
jgi:hypothetical protein